VSLAICLLGLPPAFALPQGAVNTSGQATVTQNAAGQMLIQQSTTRAGLDWTSFSIAAGERVTVAQPGSSSILLNRVLGDNPSLIYGSLTSNGSVWLINPRGIVFGASSQVNVGGLVASTLSISNEDLASGRLQLGAGSGTPGALRAEGSITATDGSVVLVAPNLVQSGRIQARRVGLAAASEVLVDVEGDGLVFFNVRNDRLDARLQVLGSVRVDGGTADIRAAARAGFADTVLNLDGVVQARGLGTRQGRIYIDGGGQGATVVSGTLDASSVSGSGGEVTVLGQHVGLTSGSRIDASGASGGGDIRIGGGFQGHDTALRNAEITVVQAGAQLRADATAQGDGGQVVVWSDKTTQYGGSISARGGAAGGNGGQVEVSGKAYLDYAGSTDLTAPQGRAGALLLDPANIEIVTAGGDLDITQPAPDGVQIVNFTDQSGLDSKINTSGVVTQLGKGTLTLQATNNITVTDGFTSSAAGNALVLQANNNININGAISVAGGVQLRADVDGNSGGRVNLAASVNAGTGTVLISNLGSDINVVAANVTAGTISIAGTTNVTGAGVLTTSNINVTSGQTTLNANGNLTGTPLLTVSSGATLELATVNASTATVRLAGTGVSGVGALLATGASSQTGAVTLTGSASIGAGGGADLTLGAVGDGGNAFGLTKVGAGTLVLGQVNTFSGATTASAGNLNLAASALLPSSSGLIVNGGTVDWGPNNVTVATLSLQSGTLGSITTTGVLSSTATIDAQLGTVSGTLGGSAGLTKTGPGLVTLGVSNAFTGTTTLSNGTLALAVNDALAPTGSLAVGGGTLTLGTNTQTMAAVQQTGGLITSTGAGALTSTSTFDMQAGTVNATLAGTQGLTKTGTGTVTLGGVNTYTGLTTVSEGALLLSDNERLADTSTLRVNGGTFNLGGFNETVAGVQLTSGTISLGALTSTTTFDMQGGTASAALVGTVGLTKSGNGSTVILSGPNAYTGVTTVSAGTLALGGDNVLQNTGGLIVNGGTFDLTTHNDTPSLVRLVSGTITGTTGKLSSTANFDLQSGTVSAILDGAFGVAKTTGGTVTLSRANSFTGNTTVTAGTLSVTNSGGLSSAPTTATVSGTGTLEINDVAIADNVSLSLAGTGNGGIGALVGTGTNAEAAGAVLLTANATIGGAGALKLTGVIDDGGGAPVFALTKVGGGTLTLAGSATNSYRGGTVVSAGTLKVQEAGALGTGSVGTSVSDGATLQIDGVTVATEGITLAGNGVNGVGALLGSGSNAAAGGDITLAANASIGGSLTLSGVIGDGAGTARSLTKVGSGTLTLAGAVANTYRGGTVVSEGTLSVQHGGALGPGNLATSGTSVSDGATLQIDNVTVALEPITLSGNGVGGVGALVGTGGTAAANGPITLDASTRIGNTGTLTLGGAIGESSAAFGITKVGAGTLVLANANSYTGGTAVNEGTLAVGAAGALPGTGGLVVGSGTTLDIGDIDTAVASVSLQGGTITGLAGTLSSTSADFDLRAGTVGALLGGSSGLSKTTGGTVTLSRANTFTGTTTVGEGTLTLGVNSALDPASHLVVSGGTLEMGANTLSVATVSLQDGSITGSSTLTSASDFDVRKGNISARLAGSVALLKTTGDTVTLSGANTFSGTANIGGGTLALGANSVLAGTGGVVVNGGTLDIGANNDAPPTVTLISGAITGTTGVLSSAADFSLQSGSVSAILGGASNLSKTTGGTVELSGANTYSGNTTVSGGTLKVSNDTGLGVAGASLTTVADGATLEISNAAIASTVSLNLTGAGFVSGASGIGALVGSGTSSVAGSVTLAASSSIGGDGSLALGGNVLGSGAQVLTKIGDGTLTLNGTAPTYGGGTVVAKGVLALGADGALPSAVGVNVNGGTLSIGSHSNTLDLVTLQSGSIDGTTGVLTSTAAFAVQSGSIVARLAGTAGLNKTTAGTVTLSGTNTYTGTTTVGEGTLALGADNVLADGSALVVSGTGTFDIAAHTDTVNAVSLQGGSLAGTTGVLTSSTAFDMQSGTAGAILGGSAGLNKVTAGTVTLSKVNTYTGTTSVGEGTLTLGVSNALAAAGQLDVNGGTFAIGDFSNTLASVALQSGSITGGTGTLSSGSDVDARSGSIGAILGGSAGLAKTTAGTVTLSGANTYTGTTTVGEGTLALGASNVLANASALVVNGGTFAIGTNSDTVASVSLLDGSITGGTGVLTSTADVDARKGSIDAILGGAAGLVKTTSDNVTLGAVNTYTGDTSVSLGTLALGGANRLAPGGHLLVSGGSFDLGGFAQTQAGVLLSGGTLANGTLTSTSAFDVRAGSASAVLAGTTGLTKTGAGTVTLSAVNLYTGTTAVGDGTLALAVGDGRLASAGSLTVSGNGRFDLGGFAQTLFAVHLTGGSLVNGTLTSSSAFDMQAGTASAVLAGSAGLNKTGAGTVTLDNTEAYTGATTVSNGTLALGASGHLSTASTLVVSNTGTFNLGVQSQTLAGVQQSGGTISGGTLTSTTDFDMQAGSATSVLAGSVGLNKTTGGTLTLSGANSYSGTTSIGDGTLALGANNTLPAGSAVVVTTDGTLDINSRSQAVPSLSLQGGSVIGGTGVLTSGADYDLQSGSVSAILGGSFGVMKATSGSVTLSGGNTYAGLTTVGAGTLVAAHALALGGTAQGTTVSSGATLEISNVTIAGETLTLRGTGVDPGTGNVGALVGTGSGAVAGGLVHLAGDTAIGGTGTLNLGGAIDDGGGPFGLTKLGSGTVQINVSATYGGSTTVSAGTLSLGTLNALPVGGNLVVNGGTLDIHANNSTVAGVSLVAGSIIGSGGTLTSSTTFDMQSGSASAVLGGNNGLSKTTSGTVTLSGANTYTGTTTVGDGTLALGASNVLADGSALVVNGGTFAIGANSDTVASVSLQGGSIAGSTGVLTSLATVDAQNGSIGARLGGSAGLTKTTLGTVTLSGANSYTGTTTVGAGTLALGASNVLANGSPLVVTGGVFDIGANSDTVASVSLQVGSITGGTGVLTSTATVDAQNGSIGARLGGSAGLTKTTAGSVTLSGANSYAGTTNVGAGTLTLGASNVLADGSPLVVNGGTLAIGSNSDTVASVQLLGGGITGGTGVLTSTATFDVQSGSIDAILGGSAGLAKTGVGTVTLSGANSYTGTTSVSQGTLALGASNVLADGSALLVNGGTFAIGANSDTVASVQLTGGSITGSSGVLTSTANVDAQSGSISAILGGSAGLAKTGLGTVTLSGANSYTGTTSVGQGTLVLGASNVLADGSALLVNGGTLAIGANSDTVNAVSLLGGSITGSTGVLTSTTAFDMQSGSVGAILGGSAGLAKTGAGTVTLNAVNTYTGTTTVGAGTLALGGSNRLAGAGLLAVSGGSFDLGGFAQTMAGVQLTGGTLASGTLTSTTAFDMQAGSASAVLAGSAGLSKTGLGTVTLSAANNYTGTTTVGAGTLLMGAANRMNSAGTLNVSGGTLDLGGFGQTMAGVQLTGGSLVNGTLTSSTTFDMRSGSASAVLGGSNGLSKTTAGTVTLSGANIYTGTTSVGDGTLALGASNVLADGSALLVNGGTFAIGANSDTVASLSLLSGSITGGVGVLTSLSTVDAQSGSISARLGGIAGLTKTTSGSVSLSGANSYAGNTRVDDGTLALGNSDVLANSSALVVNGGTFAIGANSDTVASVLLNGGSITGGVGVLTSLANVAAQSGSIGARLGGSAGLTKTTAGSVTLSGANSYTGTTNVGAGTLTLGASNVLADGSPLVVNGGTLAIGSNSDTVASVQLLGGGITGGTGVLTSTATFDVQSGSIDAILGGSAGLAKTGVGTVTLSGANSYTGTTSVSQGTLALGASNVLADGSALLVNGGTFAIGANSDTVASVQLTGGSITGSSGVLTSTANVDAQSGSISAILGGSAGLAKTGLGTVTLSGANSYTGTTSVGQGTLVLGASNVLADGSALLVNGGTLAIGANSDTVNAVSLLGGSITGSTGVLTSTTAFDMQSGSVGAILGGSAGLAKTGAGTVTLNAVNTYTGTTTVGAGTLALGGSNRLAGAGLLAVSGGSFDLGGFAQTMAGVQLTGGTLANGTLTSATAFDMQAGSASAVLAGSAGLSKTGLGTVTLSAANTYTGTTTVGAGTLTLGGNTGNVLADASALVVDGGTFDINSRNETVASVSLRNGTISGGSGLLVSTATYDVRNGVISAILDGSAGLTKTTAGTVTLTRTNIYTGPTTISGGTLVLLATKGVAGTTNLVVDGGIFDVGALDSTVASLTLLNNGAITGTTGVLTSTGTFDVRSGTIGAILGGTAGLNKTTEGTVTLTAANTYTGTTTVSGGTLALGANQVIAGAGTLVVNGGTFDLGGFAQALAGVHLLSGSLTNGTLSSASTFDMQSGSASAALGGSVGLSKTTAGTVTLGGLNTYTGVTNVSAGTLLLDGSDRLNPAGHLQVSGGSLDLGGFSQTLAGVQLTGGSLANGTLTSSSTFDVQSGSVGAILAGSAGLTKTSTGTVTLGGANTYTGATTVSAGTLALGAGNVLADTSTLVVDGGTFDINSRNDTVAGVSLKSGSITGSSGVLTSSTAFDVQSGSAGAILGGSAGLTKTTAGTVTLGGANTYTGATTVNAGTLALGASNRLADASTLVVTGGSFSLGGFADTVAGVQLTGGSLVGGALTSSTAFDMQAGTVGAVLGGSAGLAKTTAGTVTLNGANTYTGLTTVSAGTLVLGASNRLDASGTLQVSGGSFDLGGFAQTLAGVQLTGGSLVNGTLTSSTAFDMQAGSASAVLAGTSGLTKTSAGTVTLSGGNTYTGATTVNAGTLTLGASNVLADASTLVVDGGTFDINSRNDTVAGVSLKSGSITGSSGVLTSTSTFDVQSGSVGAILGGSAGLTKTTAGTVTLAGANTYTGVSTVNAGTLALGSSNVLADASTLVVDGGSFDINSRSDTVAGVSLRAGSITGSSGTLTSTSTFDVQGGDITAILGGSAGLTKTTAATVTLSGANSYTGVSTVNAGTLALGNSNVLADAGTLVVNGGSFDLGGNADTVAGVRLTGGSLQGGTLTSTSTFDVQAGSASAVLAGSTGLAKSGAGSVTLSGANTYTGVTTVSAGTLVLGASDRLNPTGSLQVSGGSLDLGGFSQTLAGVQLTGGSLVNGTLTSSSTFDMQAGSASAVLAGTAGLAKTSAGTVTLSGGNTYTGATTVSAGTLTLGASNVLADAGTLVVDGGTFDINSRNDTVAGVSLRAGSITGSTGTLTSSSTFDVQSGSVGAILAGSAGLTKTSTGTVTLGGANTYTGATTVSAGTLALGAGNVLADTSTLVVDGGTFDINSRNDTVAGVSLKSGSITGSSGVLTSSTAFDVQSGSAGAILGGSAGLTKTTAGTVTLGGANTYTGATTVNAGTLALGASNRLADASTLVVTGGSFSLGGFADTVAGVQLTGGSLVGGALTSSTAFDMQAGTVGAVLGGSAGLAKTTAGTVTLNGANTYTGLTTVSAGTLVLGASNRLDASGTLQVSGGSFDLGGFAQTLAGVQLTGGSLVNGTLTSSTAFDMQAGSASAVLAGTSGLTKTSAGTVTLSGGNTYTGATTVNAGTLTLGASNVLADASTLVVDGGTFDINSRNDTVAGVSLKSGSITGSSGVLTSTSTFDVQSGSVGAILGGSAGLTKTTAGTVTLAGANTYTGVSTVNAGTLALGSSNVLADASTLVVDGGSFDINSRSDTVAGVSLRAGSITGSSGTLTSTSTFDVQGGDITAILGGSAGLTKTTAATVTLSGANSYTGVSTVNAGTLALGNSNVLADAGTLVVDGGTFDINSRNDTLAGVSLRAGSITGGSGTLTSTTDFDLRSGTVTAILGGTVGLVKSTTGSVTLAGANTYGGATTVNAGTLVLASADRLPDSTGLGIASGASVTMNGNDQVASLALSGTLGGSGKLQAATYTLAGGTANADLGTGALSASGSSALNGSSDAGIVDVTGHLTLGSADRLANTATVNVAAGGTLTLGGSDLVGLLNLAGTLDGSGTLSATTYALAGGTANANLGPGTLTSAGSSTLNSTSAAGTVNVNGGTLTLGAADRLDNGAAVTVAGGATLRLTGNDTVQTLTLAGTPGNSARLDGSGTLTAASYALTDGIVVADLGTGTLVSGGDSSLVGHAAVSLLTVSDGTLSLASANRFSALPAASLAGGATLAMTGDQSFGSLDGSGTLNLAGFTLSTGSGGDSLFAGVIAGSGSLVKQGGSTFTLTGSSTYTGSTLVLAGTLALGNGGTTGSLATSDLQLTGTLRVAHSNNLTLAMPITGSGSVEQVGDGATGGSLSFSGGNKTYSGSTTVSHGSLVTLGNEDLPDLSAVSVAAGATLTLGGRETVRSINALGSVALGGDFTTSGDMLLSGAVTVPGGLGLTLTGQRIDAVNPGNRWGSSLSLIAGDRVTLNSGLDGQQLPLILGTVTVANGGRIDAGLLTLSGATSINGGTLELVSAAPRAITEPGADLANKLATKFLIAYADDAVVQGSGAASAINVATGATLRVSSTAGGSIRLMQANNLFNGNLSVISGDPAAAWAVNETPGNFAGGLQTYALQSRVRVAGTTVNIGDQGIVADVVAITADRLATLGGAAIVARLPFDSTVGTGQSLPGLTLELTPAAFDLSFPFGSSGAGNGIRVSVGSQQLGNRTLPLDAGYVTVLPRGGAKGTTAVLLEGPIVNASGGYRFFFDGAGIQGEIPVFYNGLQPTTPQVESSISATVSVSESARKERFEEAVRTENVATRLRAGVIAEVGPAPSATQGTEGARPPQSCPPGGTELKCGPTTPLKAPTP
jgi:filamentous hemagglutinin family protein